MLEKIQEKFDNFTIVIGWVHERYNCLKRKNPEGRQVDRSLQNSALRSLAQTYGFCACLADSLLRDWIVLGIHNNNLCKHHLQEKRLDLKKCWDLPRSSAAAACHLRNISTANNSMIVWSTTYCNSQSLLISDQWKVQFLNCCVDGKVKHKNNLLSKEFMSWVKL